MKTIGKYTFFWRGILSQWAKTPFWVWGVKYKTAEHYMMAEKAKLFGDYIMQERILAAKTPREAKDLGRQVSGFNQDIWDKKAQEIVYQGNMAKFAQNDDALKVLLETDGTILVEASPYDCIWGIGMREEDTGIENPANWKGQNLLGKVLTKVRETLIKTQ